MKIRTDFVTNSSSSSFVFKKGASVAELQKSIRESADRFLASVPSMTKDKQESAKFLYDDLKEIVGNLGEYVEDVKDKWNGTAKHVINVFFDELIMKCTGIEEAYKNINRCEESVFMNEANTALDKEVLERVLNLVIVFTVLEEGLNLNDDRIDKNTAMLAIKKFLIDIDDHYSYKSVYDYVYRILYENFSYFRECAETLDRNFIEFVSETLDCDYVLHDEYDEADWVKTDIISGMKECVYFSDSR